jgi:CBS domain-containing protein
MKIERRIMFEMRVKSVMSFPVITCPPETTLGEASRTMRGIDSGMLPVVRNGETLGVITDRDISLALADCDRRPSEISVGDAMSRGVLTCREDDDVGKNLATMRARRVRRLPVVTTAGKLCGILSINDVVRHTEQAGDGQAISYEDTIKTLQHICEHRYPVAPEKPTDVTELARFV